MSRSAYTLFETSIGTCGIAWVETEPAAKPSGKRSSGAVQIAITFFQLPEANKAKTEARLAKRSGGEWSLAPKSIAAIIDKVRRHLEGVKQDFRDTPITFSAPPFAQRVYEEVRHVASGTTVTYGELAERAGSPGAARAVGQAMRNNPIPLIIPCHRVLASGNKPGGFSAHGGNSTKERMLMVEGASFGKPRTIRDAADLRRAAKYLAQRDPRLAKFFAQPISMRIRNDRSPYEALFGGIVSQQLSTKAAATILGRVKAIVDEERIPTPEEFLAIADSTLREAGLSGNKTRALQDLALKSIDGTVPAPNEIVRMSDAEIIDRLTSIRGIGKWTVEMLLIFGLSRRDVFPVDDLGVRKGYALALGLSEMPTAKELLPLGDIWRPERTTASLYLWHAANTMAGAQTAKPDKLQATPKKRPASTTAKPSHRKQAMGERPKKRKR